MASSLIRGRYVLTRASADATRFIENGAVFQRDGAIVAVGPYQELRQRYQPDEALGSADSLVMPGLVNTHHHGGGLTNYQMGIPDEPGEIWGVLLRARRSAPPALLWQMVCMLLIRSGVTTVLYNHLMGAERHMYDGVDTTMRAFTDAGMRVAYSMAYSDRGAIVLGDVEAFLRSLPEELAREVAPGPAIEADKYFARFQELHERHREDPLVNILLSPSSPESCSPEVLQEMARLMRAHKTGLHVHLAENLYSVMHGLRTWGVTPTRYLYDLGVLGPQVSCAHCVWLSEDDLDLLAETNTIISHQPGVNLRLQDGVAPVLPALRRGIRVSIGTDGNSLNDDDDFLQEMRLAYRLHRVPGIGQERLSAHQVLQMATQFGAEATLFDDRVGALEPGRRADIVVMDLDSILEPYLDPEVSIVDALVHRARRTSIDTVLIDGRVVYRDKRFTELDWEGVTKEVAARLAQPSATAEERRRVARALIPYIVKHYEGWWDPAQALPYYAYNSRRAPGSA